MGFVEVTLIPAFGNLDVDRRMGRDPTFPASSEINNKGKKGFVGQHIVPASGFFGIGRDTSVLVVITAPNARMATNINPSLLQQLLYLETLFEITVEVPDNASGVGRLGSHLGTNGLNYAISLAFGFGIVSATSRQISGVTVIPQMTVHLNVQMPSPPNNTSLLKNVRLGIDFDRFVNVVRESPDAT